MMPYSALKQVIRFANPALVMNGVLDLFLAQPFGTRSLAQRIFGMALNDGIKGTQKLIDALMLKVGDPALCNRIKAFTNAPEDMKILIRNRAAAESSDLIIAIVQSEELQPEATDEQKGKVFNAWVAWNSAVENVSLFADGSTSIWTKRCNRLMRSSSRVLNSLYS